MAKRKAVKGKGKRVKKVVDAPLVLIEVAGGLVQNIYTDTRIDVVLVDWDNINDGDKVQYMKLEPDNKAGVALLIEAQRVMDEVAGDKKQAGGCTGECTGCSCQKED